MNYDFSGWATKAGLKCADGLTIGVDAFKDCDGKKVPLIWNHGHSSPLNVLGHAELEARPEGVYAYCTFNNTQQAQAAKEMVQHGDVESLSIFANRLKKNGSYVMHGNIREVSLVLAGANPGAFIDNVIRHSDDGDIVSDSELVIFTGEELSHGDCEPDKKKGDDKTLEHNNQNESSKEGKTLEEVVNSMNDEQKEALYAIVGAVKSGVGEDQDVDGGNDMKHNIFANNRGSDVDEVLSHADCNKEQLFKDGNRYGSLKDSFIAHGIENLDILFPDFQSLDKTPQFIKRDMGWVANVMTKVHKTPFSRIKSMFADITADDARAKGYIKGNLKKEEVFTLLKRTTTPTTVYKKQKFDRDDILDINDFDVLAWVKAEMRMMLDEEIARAILVGDGRSTASDDKINEGCIRPIYTDQSLFTVRKTFNVNGLSENEAAKEFIRTCIKARKEYKGSGNPTLYTSEDRLTSMLLITDDMGRDIYDSIDKLKSKLRVHDIVTVPPMENITRTNDEQTVLTLDGIIVNLDDYNLGADKGGSVSFFDDFDIDYNKQKYLIETRCSGALIKPYSAMVIEHENTARS